MQKCTLEKLIEILETILRALGYGPIENITIRQNNSTSVSYFKH